MDWTHQLLDLSHSYYGLHAGALSGAQSHCGDTCCGDAQCSLRCDFVLLDGAAVDAAPQTRGRSGSLRFAIIVAVAAALSPTHPNRSPACLRKRYQAHRKPKSPESAYFK